MKGGRVLNLEITTPDLGTFSYAYDGFLPKSERGRVLNLEITTPDLYTNRNRVRLL